MFDDALFQKYLVQYKKDLTTGHWDAESYKWKAVKQFQENWDIGSQDFKDMLERSLEASSNLLTSYNHYPKNMLLEFATEVPEETRALFVSLFDESRDYLDRIEAFNLGSEVLRKTYRPTAKNHYQNENVITTYLWLRYPDKYYVYKYTVAKAAFEQLGNNRSIIKGRRGDNLRFHLGFYNEICERLKKDDELIDLFNSQLTPDYYPDPQLRTLTADFCYYVSNHKEENPSSNHLSSGEHDFWWLNANPSLWKPSSVPIGSSQSYTMYSENGSKRRVFQHFLDAKPGDALVIFETSPIKMITALGTISKDHDNERIYFEKTADIANPIALESLKTKQELASMEYFINPQGSLFKLTASEYQTIINMIEHSNTTPATSVRPYDKESFLRDVFMGKSDYDCLKSVLLRKKNVILQGAPAVGKTFAARRLAWSIMGKRDNDHIKLIQFHQSYSYEDFVMGYKPEGDSFALKHGVFYNFCQKAASHPEEQFFFIIDEINRGNMSKIFGELLMLIERDYRGSEATLAYDGSPFSVPENLYIIGMMNTADRSLAMIDYALRRRFSFFEMTPGFETTGFKAYQQQLSSETIDELIALIEKLNDEIRTDKSLGTGFCIGHSYFCGVNPDEASDEWAREIVDYDILPMLREYWFDCDEKVLKWENALHGVFQQ